MRRGRSPLRRLPVRQSEAAPVALRLLGVATSMRGEGPGDARDEHADTIAAALFELCAGLLPHVPLSCVVLGVPRGRDVALYLCADARVHALLDAQQGVDVENESRDPDELRLVAIDARGRCSVVIVPDARSVA